MRALVLSLLFATAFAGCAGAIEHDLKRESARVMSPTPYPDSVMLSEIRRDRLGNVRTWVATTPSGVYDCSIEPPERHPLCAKRRER
jgi:hypothetical protein